MQHGNAPLTPYGRRRLVALVEDDGLTFEAAAAASNVAKSTCWEWVRRWREATDAQRRDLSCLRDRSSRPRTSPRQVPDEEARMICERREDRLEPRRLADEADISRAASTVHRVLRRGGCSRRARPPAPTVIRYEWPCPGNLLHMDMGPGGCRAGEDHESRLPSEPRGARFSVEFSAARPNGGQGSARATLSL